MAMSFETHPIGLHESRNHFDTINSGCGEHKASLRYKQHYTEATKCKGNPARTAVSKAQRNASISNHRSRELSSAINNQLLVGNAIPKAQRNASASNTLSDNPVVPLTNC